MSINHTSNLNEIKSLIELGGLQYESKWVIAQLGEYLNNLITISSDGPSNSRKAVEKLIREYDSNEREFLYEVNQSLSTSPKTVVEVVSTALQLGKSVQVLLYEEPIEGHTNVDVWPVYDPTEGLKIRISLLN